MADVPGNSTTGVTITVGTTIQGDIETLGDHDWYRISLTAGQKISIALNVVTLEDPYLYLRSSSGTILAENDDGGGGRGSRLVFTAPTTGIYYIDASAWVNDGTDTDYTGTGTYQLSVSNYVLPGVGTLDEIANQMTHGFFGGDYHHFNVTQGGTITVDLTGITDVGRTVALQALQQWSDIIGVNFVEQPGNAQITFDDLDQGTGAFADTVHEDHITTSAIVNVASYRINLHTYMHEIGHALGLGHTSNSNAGTAGAVYPEDALWSNDASAISIMSYFDNGENGYYANLGFSNVAIKTPQVADIIAIGNLYGLSTTTRVGDTTYGFNNNSGRTAFDAALNPNVSYTIFDSGGIDTLDYSGFAGNQLINLNSEAFSNVGALVGNVVIARGTVIENAIGGSGNDQLIGNAAANVLIGGLGADIMDGGAGNDRIYFDAADNYAQVKGGSGLDTLVFKDVSVPAGLNLAGQGFERAEVVQTDGNASNPWSAIVKTLDAGWNLMNQTTTYDDGSSVVVDIDQQQIGGIAQVWSTYDSQQRLSTMDRIATDGSHTFLNLDEDNSQPFSQDWFVYDSQGRLDSEDVHYDNGTRTFVNVDQDNSFAWVQDWFAYDAQGRFDSEDVHYDDGTRTFINSDESNSQSWEQDWFAYDSQGRLDSEDVRYGGAMHTFINIDQDNSQSWSQAWFVYDAQGRLDTQDVIYDDGTHIFYNYDQAGTEAFQLTAFLYDPSGHAYQQVVQWDDGSTTYTNL